MSSINTRSSFQYCMLADCWYQTPYMPESNMENQLNNHVNVEEGRQAKQRGTGSDDRVANHKSVRSSDFLLRLLAIATTLVAAVVMGVAKETQTVPIFLIPGMAPIFVTAPAKMRYSSALIYFVVANAIASAYAAFSLVAMIGVRVGSKNLAVLITTVDVIMVGLISSANGAAATIGVLGYRGNSHVGWNKVCNVYGKFCRNVAASVIVSLIGSFVFILLAALSILHLHRRS